LVEAKNYTKKNGISQLKLNGRRNCT